MIRGNTRICCLFRGVWKSSSLNLQVRRNLMTASENLKSPAAVSKIAEFVSHLRQLKYKKKKYLSTRVEIKSLFLFSDLSAFFYHQQNGLFLPNAFFLQILLLSAFIIERLYTSFYNSHDKDIIRPDHMERLSFFSFSSIILCLVVSIIFAFSVSRICDRVKLWNLLVSTFGKCLNLLGASGSNTTPLLSHFAPCELLRSLKYALHPLVKPTISPSSV